MDYKAKSSTTSSNRTSEDTSDAFYLINFGVDKEEVLHVLCVVCALCILSTQSGLEIAFYQMLFLIFRRLHFDFALYYVPCVYILRCFYSLLSEGSIHYFLFKALHLNHIYAIR